MRGVKLARLFAGIGGEHADQIFVDEAKHIITLPAIGGDVLDEMNQIADGLGLPGGGIAELAQAGFQCLKNAFEEALMVRVDEATERGQSFAHMGNIKVGLGINPSGEQVLVGDEIANAAFDMVNGFHVPFRKRADIGITEFLTFGKPDQFVREIFVKDEAEDVILVFVRLDF